MELTSILALVISFVLTLILGRFVLAELRRLKAGQEIRKEGPQWHAGKAGTPTMGGIAFIAATVIVAAMAIAALVARHAGNRWFVDSIQTGSAAHSPRFLFSGA